MAFIGVFKGIPLQSLLVIQDQIAFLREMLGFSAGGVNPKIIGGLTP